MLSRLDDLYRRIVPHDGGVVDRQWHLRETETAIIQCVAGAGDFKHGHHVQGVIEGNGPVAEVDVEEGGGMAGEPARLQPDSTTGDGPFGTVLRDGLASTCAIINLDPPRT